ncbi:MAG: hypothetical protein JNN17_25335 [Verrucomicrobiaceae bacterium]|nr:hypothetical protein [Verrucomicrobiaceae bacterium]
MSETNADAPKAISAPKCRAVHSAHIDKIDKTRAPRVNCGAAEVIAPS